MKQVSRRSTWDNCTNIPIASKANGIFEIAQLVYKFVKFLLLEAIAIPCGIVIALRSCISDDRKSLLFLAAATIYFPLTTLPTARATLRIIKRAVLQQIPYFGNSFLEKKDIKKIKSR